MTGYKENLSEMVEKESHLRVVLGDDANYIVKGFRSTSLQLESNDLLQLDDVLYVPSMKRNLVSISALEDKRYRVTFADGNVLALHKNSSMNTAKVISIREESLYRLTTPPAQALVHDSTNINELWHRRLAHLNSQALPALKNMVTGLPMLHVDHDGVCRVCALGNNTKGSFPKSENKSKGILDLIHSDLCGPMTVTSLDGYNYYVTFVDDHSRKTWIYFLKTKEYEEVLSNFKDFKA